MYKPLILLLIFLFSFNNDVLYAQKKYEKYLTKAKVLYKKGDYKKSIKQIEKLRSKSRAKLGNNNKYESLATLLEARCYHDMGQILKFTQFLNQGLDQSEASNSAESSDYALDILDAADMYIDYGNFIIAQEYLTKAKDLFEKNGVLDDDLKADIALKEAQITSGRGFNRQALKLIDDNWDVMFKRALDKETYTDANGKIKTRTLGQVERERRFTEFAEMLNLRANTLRKMGDVDKADESFIFAKNWISRNLGEGNLNYAMSHYLQTRMLEENGGKKYIEKEFEKSLKYITKEHKDYHYLKLAIEESLLRNLLDNDQMKEFSNKQRSFEREIKSYHGKNSLHYLNNTTVELTGRFSKDKVKDLESKAAAILSSKSILPDIHPRRIALYDFLYEVSVADQKYSNAKNYLTDILRIQKELYGESSPNYHLTRIRYGQHLLNYEDNIEAADTIFIESFENIVKHEIAPKHNQYIDILNGLAQLYEIRDQYTLASETLRKAQEAARKKYDPEDEAYAIQLDKVSNLQLKLGQYDDARENIKISIEILKKLRKKGLRIYYSKALETQAKLYALEGQFDEAEDALEESHKEEGRSSIAMRTNSDGAIDDLASLYISLGRYTETEELLTKSIENKTKLFGESTSRLIIPLTNLGKLKLIEGNYTDAEKMARRANNIGLNTFGANSTKIAPSLILLSEINSAIGDYDQAERNINEALRIQEAQFGRAHIEVAKSLSQLALIKFYKNDDLTEIRKIFNEARFITAGKLGTSNPRFALILKDLALVDIAEGKYQEAFALLSQSEKIWESRLGRRNNVNAANIYLLEGDIHFAKRDYDAAEERYQQAKKLYQRIFNKEHPQYVKVLSKLSKLYYMTENYGRAKKNIDESLANYDNFIQKFFPALSEREKAKYWNTIKEDFEFFNTFAVTQRDSYPNLIGTMYNNALLTKALLLSSSIKMRERILNSTDQVLKEKYADWLTKKETLTSVLSMSKDQLIENDIDPHNLSREIEHLEKSLSEQSELFAQDFENKLITWENVKNALNENEVAIEMIRFRYFDHVLTDSIIYAALIVKSKTRGNPELITLNNGYDLENKLFKAYRNSIKFRVADRFSYDNYWEPIQKEAGEFSTIFLSSDGVYNQLNLEAIPTKDGRYVLDNSNIVLVSNTKDIYLSRIKTKATREQNDALMFGNPQFYASRRKNENVSQLPGTELEVNELQKVLEREGWHSDYYLNERATEGNLKKINNPKIFHIATHGFFTSTKDYNEARANQGIDINLDNAQANQNPLLRTGLLLTGAGDLLDKTSYNYNMDDGILTAYEAMNLNLDYTDLVVLSACETGLGDVTAGEGVYGLQRAFLVAGAKTLIMSLFKVSDDATQKLMVLFYQKWLHTGDKRQAFIDAKKELRNEYKDPIYWGAFIMIGID